MTNLRYNVTETFVFGLGSGLGWTLAIVMMAGIRERMKKSRIPPALEGPGIALIITGIIALAFIGFSGIIQQ
jgi:Na+-transporting NADH:ubiquinone oxidoreductase subunit E